MAQRTVFCRKYQEELPALPVPPMPGDKGQQLQQSVSLKAWQAWQKQQVMLINEKQLSLASPEDRKYLETQMERFLDNAEHDTATGYVPPSADA